MSKITRETMLIFASSAGANQLEKFGSLANGTPVYVNPDSTGVAAIQSLSNYLEGWFGGVVGSNLPAIQDLNALCFLFAYQLAYIFQAGVAEWDAGTTYYTGSFVQSSGTLFTSLQDNNTNHAVSDPAWWTGATQPAAEVFTESGTFTAPPGVTSVTVITDFPSQGADFNFNGLNQSGEFGLIDPNGNIWTWGAGGNGSVFGIGLGIGSSSASTSSPIMVVAPGSYFRQVFIGNRAGAGLDTFGRLWTWGQNLSGQLGSGGTTNTSVPGLVLGNTRFSKIVDGSLSNTYMGALDSANKLWMWGENASGSLGNGNSTDQSSPVAVLGNHTFTSVHLGYTGLGAYGLGIDENSVLWSWGTNGNGQLGVGDTTAKSSPILVLGSHLWQSVIPFGWSTLNTLGLDTSGKLWAWGGNTKGALGDGTNTAKSSPIAVLSNLVFTELMQGMVFNNSHIGALDVDGNAWMWGENINGQLGDGTVTPRSSPVMVVGGVVFEHIFGAMDDNGLSIGSSFGLDADGNIWSWGSNSHGILGANLDPGSVAAVSSPVMVVGGNVWKWLWIGRSDDTSIFGATAWAMDQYGQIWSWGWNGKGAIGDGTATDRSSPVLVTGPANPMLVNAQPHIQRIAVVPGQSYAVNLGWASTFGGTILGYLAKSITVEYV